MKLKIDEANGFTKFEGVQSVVEEYPTRESIAKAVKFGDTVTFDLDSYEELVAEIHAGSGPPADVPPGLPISFAPTAVLKQGNDVTVSTVVDVPAGYPQARVAVLFEPDQEVRGVKADAVDGSKPLALSTENGGRGIWYWYWADLTPGKHSIELTIHSAAPSHISAWMLTRRNLGSPRSAGLLPAQSNIERGTHLLLEETIR
jgi:hypothetical protein